MSPVLKGHRAYTSAMAATLITGAIVTDPHEIANVLGVAGIRYFLEAAERYRYSIDRLTAEFGANVEQVSHRFTTMGRQGARGIGRSA